VNQVPTTYSRTQSTWHIRSIPRDSKRLPDALLDYLLDLDSHPRPRRVALTVGLSDTFAVHQPVPLLASFQDTSPLRACRLAKRGALGTAAERVSESDHAVRVAGTVPEASLARTENKTREGGKVGLQSRKRPYSFPRGFVGLSYSMHWW
jgi:hypothetical protein